MSTEEVVSHGRGGAGNILPDDTPYTDGEIVREGPVGDQGDGAYSAGRGGAGNIGGGGVGKEHAHAHHGQLGGGGGDGGGGVGKGDSEIVPETALHEAGGEYANYHTGRGGEGNIHRDAGSGTTHKGLADKLKEKMFKKSEK